MSRAQPEEAVSGSGSGVVAAADLVSVDDMSDLYCLCSHYRPKTRSGISARLRPAQVAGTLITDRAGITTTTTSTAPPSGTPSSYRALLLSLEPLSLYPDQQYTRDLHFWDILLPLYGSVHVQHIFGKTVNDDYDPLQGAIR